MAEKKNTPKTAKPKKVSENKFRAKVSADIKKLTEEIVKRRKKDLEELAKY